MLEFNVLQWAVMISNGFKYFLFLESSEHDLKTPMEIQIKVIPFQKLQDAKAIKSLFGNSVYMLKSINDYELLYEMAQGIDGIKYWVHNFVEFKNLEIKKAIALVN
ncbi:MAG: hypothetical protein H7329_05445 [Opitutaceae bacterium]|nr:hypothetical protein [Cytophagales bacterium]